MPGWLRGYRPRDLRFDLIAGLTVWALVVPQSIAYAQIAGLPPQAGVFCAFAAPVGYALLGTSRQLIVGPTSATAAISFSLIAPLAASDTERFRDLAALLAILSGVVFVLLGLWKLGFVSQFIATSVQVGFLFGLGLTIMIGQLFDVLGIEKSGDTFWEQLRHLVSHLDEASGWTALIGLGGLAAMFAFKRFAPSVPAALLCVAAAIVLVAALNLEDRGVAIVGDVDRAVPLPAIPREIRWSDFTTLLPATLAIVIIGYSESVSVAQGFAEEHKYDIEPNRELGALGVSAAAAGLFQGFIAGGGASQSAANDRAGARTQGAGVALAVLAALTSIALMPLFRDLPIAVLAAIVISAVVGFLNVHELRRLRALRGDSFVFALLALLGVLFLGILPGLLMTAGLSLIVVVERFSRPRVSVLGRLPGSAVFGSVDRYPAAETQPDVAIFRPDAPLLFLNAAWVRDEVRRELEARAMPPRLVVLDLEQSADLDVKGLDVIEKLREYLEEHGSSLALANLRGPGRDMLDRAEAEGSVQRIARYLSVEQAVSGERAEEQERSPSR